MTWVSVSLRKMELKNRINSLESELIDISQRLQTIAADNANEQTKISLERNYNLGRIRDKYSSDMVTIFNADSTNSDKSGIITSILSGYFKDPSNPTAEEMESLREDLGFSETELPDDIGNVNDIYDILFISGNLEGSSEKLFNNWMLTSQYLDDKMEAETLSQAKSDTLRSETDAETQTLEAQQEAVQTQIKAARAEYDSLGEALDKDIETSTIKLV